MICRTEKGIRMLKRFIFLSYLLKMTREASGCSSVRVLAYHAQGSRFDPQHGETKQNTTATATKRPPKQSRRNIVECCHLLKMKNN